jgi:hypothetical protein
MWRKIGREDVARGIDKGGRASHFSRQWPISTVMTDLIETPCQKVCVVDPLTGYCIGCGRDRAEIAGWLAMSPKERRGVMADLPARLTAMTRERPRRGRRRLEAAE